MFLSPEIKQNKPIIVNPMNKYKLLTLMFFKIKKKPIKPKYNTKLPTISSSPKGPDNL